MAPPPSTRQEHARIVDLAERLRAPADPASLRRDVHELMSFLPAHLYFEERPDSPLALALAGVPDEQWRLEALRDEHARILEMLEVSFALVERDDGWDQARVEASALAAELLAHERREAAVFARFGRRR
jgi:hypothetical protein